MIAAKSALIEIIFSLEACTESPTIAQFQYRLIARRWVHLGDQRFQSRVIRDVPPLIFRVLILIGWNYQGCSSLASSRASENLSMIATDPKHKRIH